MMIVLIKVELRPFILKQTYQIKKKKYNFELGNVVRKVFQTRREHPSNSAKLKRMCLDSSDGDGVQVYFDSKCPSLVDHFNLNIKICIRLLVAVKVSQERYE